MSDKVVDASALAAVAFREPQEQIIRDRLRGHRWHAPSLLGYEMASICLKKIRADPSQRRTLLEQHSRWPLVPFRVHAVDFAEALNLAERHNLSSYDASYLWLARNLRAELVTLDEKLQRAARAP